MMALLRLLFWLMGWRPPREEYPPARVTFYEFDSRVRSNHAKRS